jgi:hypothetical protein
MEFRGRHTYFAGFLEAGGRQMSLAEANGVPGTACSPAARKR